MKALQLVFWNEEKKRYELDPEAVAFLKTITTAVAIICSVGKERLGKSAFWRYLFPSVHFQVGHTEKGCTKGIKLWKHKFSGETCYFIILDSEGLFGLHTPTEHHDAHLMMILALLSSEFIFQMRGTIDETNFKQLELVLSLAEKIQAKAAPKLKLQKSKKRKTTHEESGLLTLEDKLLQLQPYIAPRIYFISRDFHNQRTFASPNEYLEDSLKETEESKDDTSSSSSSSTPSTTSSSISSASSSSSSSSPSSPDVSSESSLASSTELPKPKPKYTQKPKLNQALNRVKRAIKICFPDRSCYLLPTPLEPSLLSEMNKLDKNDPRFEPEFKKEADRFLKDLLRKMKPKQYDGKFLNGIHLCTTLENLLQAINEHTIPVMEDQISILETLGNTAVYENAVSQFGIVSNNIKNLFLSPSHPVCFLHSHFQKALQNVKEWFLNDFTTQMKESFGGLNSVSGEQNEKKFLSLINSEIGTIESMNLRSLFQEISRLSTEFEHRTRMEIPKLTIPELIKHFPETIEDGSGSDFFFDFAAVSSASSSSSYSSSTSAFDKENKEKDKEKEKLPKFLQTIFFNPYFDFQSDCLEREFKCFSPLMKLTLNFEEMRSLCTKNEIILCPQTHSVFYQEANKVYLKIFKAVCQQISSQIQQGKLETKQTSNKFEILLHQKEEESKKLREALELSELGKSKTQEIIDEATLKATSMMQSIKTKEKEVSKLQDYIERQKQLLQDSESQIKDHKETIETLELRVKEHLQQFEVIFGTLREAEEKIQMMELQKEEIVKATEQVWNTAKRREESLLISQKEEKEQFQKLKEQLSQKLAELEENIRKMEKELEIKKSECAKLNLGLAEAKLIEKEKDELQDQVKSLTKENNQIPILQTRLRTLETSLEETKRKLTEKSASYDDFVRKLSSNRSLPSPMIPTSSSSSSLAMPSLSYNPSSNSTTPTSSSSSGFRSLGNSGNGMVKLHHHQHNPFSFSADHFLSNGWLGGTGTGTGNSGKPNVSSSSSSSISPTSSGSSSGGGQPFGK